MWKNVNKLSSSESLVNTVNVGGNPSIDWLLASGTISSYPDVQIEKGAPRLREQTLSDAFLNLNNNLDKNISQIHDPLWRRVCENILKVLGPDAFSDLWKAKLVRVSPEGKISYFVCPSQAIAGTMEDYHFVVMGALKEFYPFLTSIETEIKEE